MNEFHVLEIGNGYGFYCDLEYVPYSPPSYNPPVKLIPKTVEYKNQTLGVYVLRLISSCVVSYVYKLIHSCISLRGFYNVKKII